MHMETLLDIGVCLNILGDYIHYVVLFSYFGIQNLPDFPLIFNRFAMSSEFVIK